MTQHDDNSGASDSPREITSLLKVMARLRDPDGGCAWDLQQDFATIAPCTIEEAYEVADAIARGDMADLRDELGDLLFQAVFHARLAEEQGAFDFYDVVEAITTKMVRRHPHIFGNGKARSADQQSAAWEDIKATERRAKGATSLLDDVPPGFPGLTRAVKLQKRAARIGFDWPSTDEVWQKITEETAELDEAMAGGVAERIEDEFGDLLFALANLSRHLRIDPEQAMRRANEKFSRRFRHVEKRHAAVTADKAAPSPTLDLMESWWQEAKREESQAPE